jgi:hypothetical protein
MEITVHSSISQRDMVLGFTATFMRVPNVTSCPFINENPCRFLMYRQKVPSCSLLNITGLPATSKYNLHLNERLQYMLLSRHQNAGQNHDIKIGNRCFENVAQFRYLGTTVINQNLIQEEIKKTLNSGNACYHSVQNILCPRLLPKNVKVF